MRYPFCLALAALLAACSLPAPVPAPDPAGPAAAAKSLPAASTGPAPTATAPGSSATSAAPAATAPGPGQAPPIEAIDAFAPNPNLYIEGIPPVPNSLVNEVAKYTEFRGHAFVDWHPLRREMLVSHRKADAQTAQLFRLAAPLGELEQLTDASDPVRNASYEPRQGKYLVFERASGGNEANQVYRLDLPSKQVTLLTDEAERNDMQGWLHRSSALIVSSVPLDKTAAAGTRSELVQTLRLIDPAQPGVSRKIAELPGTGWSVDAISWDDRQAALTRYISATESQVWLLNLASGKTTQVLPTPGAAEKAVHFAGPFTRDNGGLFVVTDRDGEFREVMLYRFGSKRLQALTGAPVWDASSLSVNDGVKSLAVRFNVDGREELRLFDAQTLRESTLPSHPTLAALTSGSVRSLQFHRKLPDLAFAVDSSKGPSQIYSVHPTSGAVEAWTRAHVPAGVELGAAPDPQIVRWPSFDQRSISGILYRPPPRFSGKRPVMVLIHGGPEAQSKLGFLGRSSYFVNELGIAVIEPNVRGSSGYGKTFLTLDNGVLREDSVRDIGSLLDWIAAQPDLDASRVLVSGGSYGGYMSLAVSARYGPRIAGAIDIVGISNFVTFLRSTESYRRDLRRVEYGDEREPAMNAFLESISPTSRAQGITKPLFVVQGRNDPRVPYTEAQQIVALARINNPFVWYLRAENEGHGIARKENADFQFYATVMFVRATLLE